MRRSRVIAHIAAVVVLTTTAAGFANGEANSGDGRLTFEEAAREAVRWHPAVAEATGVLGARGEDVAVARAGYLPQITAGLGSGYDSRVSTTWRPRPELGASQMLFDFGKVSSAVASARAGTRVGREELLQTIDQLIRDTGAAVIEYQRAAALKVVAEEQRDSVAEIGTLVSERAKLGAATRSDALQAQGRVDAAVAYLERTEIAQRRWASNLAYLIGRDRPPGAIDSDVPDWLMRACARPMPDWPDVPAVAAADARVEQAEADLRGRRADRLPTIAVGADASTDVAQPLGSSSIYSLGLRLTGNVFGGNVSRARVRGANYTLAAARAAALRARNDSAQQLAEAQSQIVSLTSIIATLATREGSMRETSRLYRLQYLEMGTRTLVDLLNAEQELYQVRLDAINTIHDLRRLELDCMYLTGYARAALGLSGTSLRGVTL